MVRTVNELLREDIPRIDKNDTLYHAFKLMEKSGIDKIIVLENRVIEPGKEVKLLAGVLTSRDIVLKLATQRLSRTTPSRVHVSSFMSFPPISIAPSSSLVEAAELMISKKIGILPVVNEANDVLGAVLKTDIVKLAENDDTEVRTIMDTSPVIARTTDRVLKVRQDMLSTDTSFVPVLDENDELVGYVTIYELAYAFVKFEDIVPSKYRKERITHLIVEDIMRFRPPKVRLADTVSQAVAEIMKKGSRGAVVLDEIGKVAGVVTIDTLLNHLVTNKRELLS